MIAEDSPVVQVAAFWRRAIALMIDGGITFAVSLAGADRFGPHDVLARGDGFLV